MVVEEILRKRYSSEEKQIEIVEEIFRKRYASEIFENKSIFLIPT